MLMSVILAAGKGTRMVSEQPKVLHPILGLPLLEHVLEKVEGLDCAPRVVVVGYGREAIETRFGSRGLVWAHQEKQLGTGHAASVGVERGVEEIGQSAIADCVVLILNGDLPLLTETTLRRLVALHREREAAVTVLTCEQTDPFGYGRIVRDAKTGALCDIVEEKDADEVTRRIRETNVGTYVFDAGVFRASFAKTNRENAQNEYYLTDVVVAAARDGLRIETLAVEDETEIAQVNSRREQAEVARVMRERRIGELMDQGVTIVDPDTVYVDMHVTIGADTTILPGTYIERDVEIGRGCEIGPFTHLRPGCRIGDKVKIGNFVEVKASTLGKGTKVSHLSYVGDATVGEKVNIGAGTVFANYDGKKKSPTVVKDGAFIGSGTILVAPVTVGKSAITGAGAVVTKSHDVPDGAVVVGVPAKPL